MDRQAREMAEELLGAGFDEEDDWGADDGEDDTPLGSSKAAAFQVAKWGYDDDEEEEGDGDGDGGLRLTVNDDWMDAEDEEGEEGAGGEGAPGGAPREGRKERRGRRGAREVDEADVAELQAKLAAGKPLSRHERAVLRDAERSRVQEVPARLLPRVAIVGRPNVGKSALFNRLVGRQEAIVYDYPGVTRDRMYTRAEWGGREFMVIDTGGISGETGSLEDYSGGAKRDKALQLGTLSDVPVEAIPSAIELQAARAIGEADVIVLVCDGQQGPTAADEEVAQYLRRWHGKRPAILAVNKCENVAQADVMCAPFWSFGMEPVPVSAISGSGSGEVLDAVVGALPPVRELDEEDTQRPIRVAIVGRPNAGKSSLLNAVTNSERSIVSDLAGTTRDAIDTEFEGPDGTPYVLVDTAGLRRRTAVAASKDGAEALSVKRALNAVRRCDVAVLVLDGTQKVTVQDFRIAERIAEEGKACVICVNKWDLVPKDSHTMPGFQKSVVSELRPVAWAEVLFTSAKTKQRVGTLLDAVQRAAREHERRVTTATLNMVVAEATAWKAPPSTKGAKRKGRIYYATQATNRPPTFVFFCNDSRLIPDDYRRYFERQLRESVGFPGTPVRLLWRGKTGGTNKA